MYTLKVTQCHSNISIVNNKCRVVKLAKETFYNLDTKKQERILQVMTKIFQDKPFQDVTVKEIVEELGIARGSFYQYFEDLEDAYFEVINNEIEDIHTLFMTILNNQTGDLEVTLNKYRDELSDILFREQSYSIYKNSYLYWNEGLTDRWNKIHTDHAQIFVNPSSGNLMDIEKMHYLKGILHMLIRRNFQEAWTKEEFKNKYQLHVEWLMKGVM